MLVTEDDIIHAKKKLSCNFDPISFNNLNNTTIKEKNEKSFENTHSRQQSPETPEIQQNPSSRREVHLNFNSINSFNNTTSNNNNGSNNASNNTNNNIDKKSFKIINDFFNNFQELFNKSNEGKQIPSELNNLVEQYKQKLVSTTSVSQESILRSQTNTFGTIKTQVLDSIIEENLGKTSTRVANKHSEYSESMENMFGFGNNNNNLNNTCTPIEKPHRPDRPDQPDTSQQDTGQPDKTERSVEKFKFHINLKNLNENKDFIVKPIQTTQSTPYDSPTPSVTKALDTESVVSGRTKKSDNSQALKDLEIKTNRMFSKYADIKNEINPEFSKHNLTNFRSKFKNSKLKSPCKSFNFVQPTKEMQEDMINDK